MKTRNYGLDLLRVFLCLCVITIHSLYYFGDMNHYFDMVFPVFLVATDGLFFMLSGYFNLDKEFNSATDILNFYKKKIIYVLLPFLGFVLFWTVWDYLHEFGSLDLMNVLRTYYETVMGGAANGHLWFMYPLFGMLLSTPFLSNMLHSLDDRELKILWRVAIGFNIVSYILCGDFGVSFGVLGWFLDGWLIYYFAGYYYRRIASKESSVKWIIIGLLGFILTIMGKEGTLPFVERFIGATDIQPFFTLFCMGYLFCWDRFINIGESVLSKVILFLSKHTYLIYLWHIQGIAYAARKLNIVESTNINGVIVVVGAFVLSLIAAVVTNLLMKPVQKFIDKIWVVK